MAAPLTPAGGGTAPLDLTEVPAGGQSGSVPHTFRALRHLAFAFSRHFYFSLAVMPVIGYSVMQQMASANTTIQTAAGAFAWSLRRSPIA
jgi:hypothetical protein